MVIKWKFIQSQKIKFHGIEYGMILWCLVIILPFSEWSLKIQMTEV